MKLWSDDIIHFLWEKIKEIKTAGGTNKRLKATINRVIIFDIENSWKKDNWI